MLGLLGYTLLTSAVDCLNPIAITQQFVLQGLVKKPKHIWCFILATGFTNLASGFLAYYGFVALIGDFFAKLMSRHGQALFTLELILGILFLVLTGYIVQGNKISSLQKQLRSLTSDENGDDDEREATKKIKSVSPLSLVLLGVGATISELTSALPYFAFLAIIFNHQLSLLQLTSILVLYNIIYMLPLIVLYFVYIKSKDRFDRLYAVIKSQITKWSNILAPTFAGGVGAVLVYHSLLSLLK